MSTSATKPTSSRSSVQQKEITSQQNTVSRSGDSIIILNCFDLFTSILYFFYHSFHLIFLSRLIYRLTYDLLTYDTIVYHFQTFYRAIWHLVFHFVFTFMTANRSESISLRKLEEPLVYFCMDQNINPNQVAVTNVQKM